MITADTIKQHNLTQDEYKRILEILGREPNLIELGIFSVMWSEHCSYKSSRKFLRNFPTKGDIVIQGPGENAGVIDIGDGQACVFKMESHNHPSFIEPYQGAATGVGGILRDVFTMGARPVALLNSLRFGEPTHPKTAFLVSGVVAGIAGYGNCMGIPTVGGEVYFDECYNGNNLVNAMTVGLVDKDKIFKGYASGPGNPLFYVGAKTGRDGIHGATMASASFDEQAEAKRPTVQVGDPFTEKKLLEACLELMSLDLIVGIQDMGAAGLTSSSFEMASRAGTGLRLELDQVPTREEGMTPYEMMLSESQERMLLVCKQGGEETVKKIFQKWDLDVSEIGRVTDDGYYRAVFKGEEVVNVPIAPLTDAAPVYDRPRQRPGYLDKVNNPANWTGLPLPKDYNQVLTKLISHPQLASKKWVYRQYDHQVMTNTVVLPGSDAAVVRVKGTKKGLCLTTNVNSRYCYLNPFDGGALTVAEGGRNIVCSGGKPLAVTDCLNFGNPERPEIMWQFEQAILGISEACNKLSIPVVSGNVSFYNETNEVSIFPTPSVGTVGLIKNVEKRIEQYFKKEGDVVLVLGETFNELGGSEFLKIEHNLLSGPMPKLDLGVELKLWKVLEEINQPDQPVSLISSAHDCTEGGLAVTILESCVSHFGQIGANIKLSSIKDVRMDALLFGESQSRVIVSAPAQNAEKIKKIAASQGIFVQEIGVVGGNNLTITVDDQKLIDLPVKSLFDSWANGFEKMIFKK